MFPDRFAFGEALAELRNVVRSEVLKLFRSNLHENVVARGKAELDMLKSQFRREVGAASEKRSQWHLDSLNLTDSMQVRNPSGKNGPGTMFLVMFTHLESKRSSTNSPEEATAIQQRSQIQASSHRAPTFTFMQPNALIGMLGSCG